MKMFINGVGDGTSPIYDTFKRAIARDEHGYTTLVGSNVTLLLEDTDVALLGFVTDPDNPMAVAEFNEKG